MTNGPTVAHLQLDNRVSVLRERDIMTEKMATSPCRKIYLIVQVMYLESGLTPETVKLYWDLVRDVLAAAPSTNDLISRMSAYIVDSDFYAALKVGKKLISYEQELISHATKLD